MIFMGDLRQKFVELSYLNQRNPTSQIKLIRCIKHG